MKCFGSRQVILLLIAFTVAVGSLLVPEPARAFEALFRVERSWYGAPPPAETVGGASKYQGWIFPYARTMTWSSAAKANVTAANLVGAPFTLPQSFISYQGTWTYKAKTHIPGYTTSSIFDYVNGEARFAKNVGPSGPTRLVFPTTGGNPIPNYGSGQPALQCPPPNSSKYTCGTTTFDGRYDFDRAGSINITPGKNRFAGTMRLIYREASSFYQYIFVDSPTNYKAYGSFKCERGGVDCNYLDTEIGETTTSGMVTRFLLNVKGTGSGPGHQANTAKATKSTTPSGPAPTPYGNKSFITAKNYYLHKINPWTTGFVSVYNYLSGPQATPQLQGYDKSLVGTDITVTHFGTFVTYDITQNKTTLSYTTFKQYLTSVMRVVSLIRPRLVHAYLKPTNPADPIEANNNLAELWTMKVYFVPEPAAVVMLGTGIAGLLGLSRIRRR
jgi:hypothetical protein